MNLLKAMESIQVIEQKIKENFEFLRKQSALLDKEVNNLYHEIETSNYSASDGYDVYKRLRSALRARKLVADELSNIQNFYRITHLDEIHDKLVMAKNKIEDKVQQTSDLTLKWEEHIKEKSIPSYPFLNLDEAAKPIETKEIVPVFLELAKA